MIKLQNEDEILNLINENKISVIYFTGSSCDACSVIKLKLENILKKLPKIKSGEINGEENLLLATKYQVFSLPIFLLFIEGKESLRIGRNIDLLEVEKKITRYYKMIF